MARIRNIKPEFFTSEAVSELPLRARLTWIGLWTHCDNHGRARDNVRLIKGAVWPLDNVSLKDIEEDLDILTAQGRIVRYQVDGKQYLEVTNWGEHQYGAFKGASKYPAPTEETGSHGPAPTVDAGVDSPKGTAPVDNSPIEAENLEPPAVPQESRQVLNVSGRRLEKSAGIQVSGVRGQEGGTRESATRPPDRCPKHRNDPHPPPCGNCADARRAAETWDDAETERAEQIGRNIDEARADPRMRCEHGTDGGLFTHPITGLSATCALCRRAQQREAS